MNSYTWAIQSTLSMFAGGGDVSKAKGIGWINEFLVEQAKEKTESSCKELFTDSVQFST